jgi:hypothetical protein
MAISLLFGSVVSTLLTLFVVPLLILIVEGKKWPEYRGRAEKGAGH